MTVKRLSCTGRKPAPADFSRQVNSFASSCHVSWNRAIDRPIMQTCNGLKCNVVPRAPLLWVCLERAKWSLYIGQLALRCLTCYCTSPVRLWPALTTCSENISILSNVAIYPIAWCDRYQNGSELEGLVNKSATFSLVSIGFMCNIPKCNNSCIFLNNINNVLT